MTLSKSVSTFTLLAASIAGLVGSGWLLGPFFAAKVAGAAAIISWPLAGILMMIVAATFVILASTMTVVGGTVRYFQLSYGHFAGFGFSWIAWLAWVAVAPIETMALLQYSTNYWSGLMTTGAHPVLTVEGIAVAIGIMALIYAINYYGVYLFSRVNNIILAFKLFIPVATCVILFSTHFNLHNFTAAGGFLSGGVKSIFAALPMAGVIYSFIGFNPAVQLAGETKNPRVAIPVAIFGSLILCIFLYTVIQAVFIGALSPAMLSHGWQHLSFTGDNGPFAGILAAFGFAWFVKVLYVDSIVSPFGTAMVQTMATSRMTYAMSDNGYFPSWLKRLNSQKSPYRALAVNMIIGVLFFLPFPSWHQMVVFLVSCLVLGYVVGPMSLMLLAKDEPEKFKCVPGWMIQVLCMAAFYICNLMIFWTGWDIMAKVSVAFAIGYVIFAISIAIRYKNKKSIENINVIKGSWVIIYIIGMAIISYLGSFGGGKGDIPFGYDFIVMAIFSIFVISYAKFFSKRSLRDNELAIII